MLRVWYSYGISLLVNRFTFVGVLLSASVSLSVKLFSLPNILLNLMDVRLGAVPQYVWQVFASTLARGELLKILVLVMIVLSTLYLFALLKDSSFNTRTVQSI